MAKIVGISGSLRRGSFNSALLRAAAEAMPQGSSMTIASIAGIPLYNADLEEADGIPAAVRDLKDAIADADGLLIVTPEYNNSMPGVLKNAIDWASRPPADSKRVFAGKCVALIGSSPGGFGTILAQQAWLPVLRTLGVRLWTGDRLMVSRAGSAFDAGGQLVDEKVLALLRQFMAGFAAEADHRAAAL